jgi:hypothetical protein
METRWEVVTTHPHEGTRYHARLRPGIERHFVVWTKDCMRKQEAYDAIAFVQRYAARAPVYEVVE